MSLTLEAMLNLPSLKDASVVAGRGALSRTITSISVLEYAEPTAVQNEFFEALEFGGSEIVISALASISDDVGAQKTVVRRLAEAGEVGLILFYLGIFVKELDPELVRLADELSFALIVMPPSRKDLRYSDVITEVMEAIVKGDSMNYVSEFLEQISMLPPELRTMKTALRMLRDKTRTSFILSDSSSEILEVCAWPRDRETLHRRLLEEDGIPSSWWFKKLSVPVNNGRGMNLYVFRESGEAMEEARLREIVDMVHLFLSIWAKDYGEAVISELVSSILKDEPIKMRRLAAMFSINIRELNTMWVVEPGTNDVHKLEAAMHSLVESYVRRPIMDVYEGFVVLFLKDGMKISMLKTEIEELLKDIPGSRLVMCGHLETTTDVRRAYLQVMKGLAAVPELFPNGKTVQLEDIGFINRIQAIVEEGEESIAKTLRPLNLLSDYEIGGELIRTLSAYLLDGGMSTQRTASMISLHNNTVKYRISRIEEILGYPVDSFPSCIALYEACALKRLIDMGPLSKWTRT